MKKNPLLSARRMRFSKKTTKIDQFLTLKRQKLDQFLTLQHIYICRVHSIFWSPEPQSHYKSNQSEHTLSPKASWGGITSLSFRDVYGRHSLVANLIERRSKGPNMSLLGPGKGSLGQGSPAPPPSSPKGYVVQLFNCFKHSSPGPSVRCHLGTEVPELIFKVSPSFFYLFEVLMWVPKCQFCSAVWGAEVPVSRKTLRTKEGSNFLGKALRAALYMIQSHVYVAALSPESILAKTGSASQCKKAACRANDPQERRVAFFGPFLLASCTLIELRSQHFAISFWQTRRCIPPFTEEV